MGSYYFYKTNNDFEGQYEIIVFQNSTGYHTPAIYYDSIAEAVLDYELNGFTSTLYNHPLPLTS